MLDQLLDAMPLFQRLTVTSRTDLVNALRPIRLGQGEQLFSLGDSAEELFIVVSGKVKLTRSSKQHQPLLTTPRRGGRPMIRPTRESLLWLFGPGDMFGELSIFDQGTRSTTATAMIDSELLTISASQMHDLMTRHHDVTAAMLHQLAHRLRRANDSMSGLVLSDVPGRLAFVLLNLADSFGQSTQRGIDVRHDLTQSELAQMVGASRETVNKVLTDFKARRWIEVHPNSILIKDLDRLRSRID